MSQVLGMEAIVSQSTLSRFFDVSGQTTCNALNGPHRQAVGSLPSLKAGYMLDLDSSSSLHEDGHQQGVALGYSRQGLEPCHRPLIAALTAPGKIEPNPTANDFRQFVLREQLGF